MLGWKKNYATNAYLTLSSRSPSCSKDVLTIIFNFGGTKEEMEYWSAQFDMLRERKLSWWQTGQSILLQRLQTRTHGNLSSLFPGFYNFNKEPDEEMDLFGWLHMDIRILFGMP
jgi:hypothetical protein